MGWEHRIVSYSQSHLRNINNSMQEHLKKMSEEGWVLIDEEPLPLRTTEATSPVGSKTYEYMFKKRKEK